MPRKQPIIVPADEIRRVLNNLERKGLAIVTPDEAPRAWDDLKHQHAEERKRQRSQENTARVPEVGLSPSPKHQRHESSQQIPQKQPIIVPADEIRHVLNNLERKGLAIVTPDEVRHA